MRAVTYGALHGLIIQIKWMRMTAADTETSISEHVR
jgi:hypothetical protein